MREQTAHILWNVGALEDPSDIDFSEQEVTQSSKPNEKKMAHQQLRCVRIRLH